MRKRLSPIDAYRLLPKTNCRKCGERNCLTFATRLVNGEVALEKCLPLRASKYAKKHGRLQALLAPAVKEVMVGVGDHAVKIGGKLAQYRHEFAYANPTAMAIDVTDEMTEEQLLSRLKRIEQFSFDYIGQPLKLDMVAVRSVSSDPEKFANSVRKVSENTHLPLILCTLDPKTMKAGLSYARQSRPLLYAATRDNWKEMADLAITHGCSLVACAFGDLSMLRSLVKTLLAYGVRNIVLDPGNVVGDHLAGSVERFTMLRRAACLLGDKLSGFPLLGVPMAAWMNREGSLKELITWQEAYTAVVLTVRYADILILHNVEGWALLPLVILRQNLYTDPRKPAVVKAGLREFGKPDANSPVMFTTNFALTYYTVVSDIEKSKLDAYLLVVDTGGIAVDSAVAGRKLTAEKIAEALKASDLVRRVNHRKIIIPGKASRLSGEIEEQTGWRVFIGPKDSSGIPSFLQKNWQKSY